MGSWNSTSTPANISSGTVSNSSGSLEILSFTWSDYGRYYPHGTRVNRTFDISVNRRTLKTDGGSFYSNYLWSTTAHEFGHALSLDDNPPVSSTASLMRHDRNRVTLYEPRPYDISDVNSIY